MIMRKWEIYVWIPVAILTLISIILNRFYWFFGPVAMVCFVAIMILICINRRLYIKDLKKRYDEELDAYLAELLANRLITKEQYTNRDPEIVLGYYRPYKETKRKVVVFIVMAAIVTLGIVWFYIPLVK